MTTGSIVIESSDIHIVRAITESGSLSKAADLLHLSQPTLSKRLARLEQSLNISLFHRHNGGMTPTHAANYILNQGGAVQAQLSAMHRHVEMLANLQGGQLNIGVGPIIEQLYFPKLLLDFVEETSNININLLTESAPRLIEHLMRGELDVIMGPFRTSDLPTDLIVTPIKSAKIIFVARANHPLLDLPAPIDFATLASYPSIFPDVPQSMRAMMPPQYKQHSPLITCENYATSKAVVAFSDYITAGPAELFEKELAQGSLVALSTTVEATWQSYCALKPESTEIPAIQMFTRVLAQYLSP